MHVACSAGEASWASWRSGGNKRVSFGTDMSMEDETSDSGSVQKSESKQETTVERFMQWKFCDKGASGTEKG
jgi:hypothetical protein